MGWGRRTQGNHYEALAADWLQARGLTLLERNYHCRRGEIDLILLDGDCLCFVEVKYRSGNGFGGVRYSITPAKQQRLLMAIEHYLERHPQQRERPQRIDALLLQQRGDDIDCDWIRDAIQAPGF